MFALIRHQLTLIICALIVLTLTTVFMISYSLVSTDYEKKMQHNNFAMAESLASNIAQFMQNAYNINELIAQSHDIVNSDVEIKHKLLVDMVQKYSFFQLLAIHNLNGEQIARSSGVLANRSERWWFKKFQVEKKPYISKTYYSVFSDSPITTIVHGIYKDDNLVEILMSDIEIDKLQEMVGNYNSGEGSYAYLLDGEGAVIAHPVRKQVTDIYNYKKMKKNILLKDVNGKVLKDANNNEMIEEYDFEVAPSLHNIITKVMAGEIGVGEYTDLDGEAYICAYRSIPLQGYSDPWSLIVVQKKSAALDFMSDVMTKTILVGSLVLILAILLTSWFSKRITNPIIDIVNATNKIKEGNLTVRITIKSDNEIGLLAMNFNRMVSELKQQRQGLERLVEERTQMAFYDTLTGLPNRESLKLYLEEEMNKTQKGDAKGLILFIDIDDFKAVNDNFGHSFGDDVIVAVSKNIVQAVGASAFVSRSGGDEFIVVLSGENNREQATALADKVIKKLCQEYQVSVEHLHMSASIGVVIYPDDGDIAEELLKRADSAMYAAKKAGRNCWRCYEASLLEEAYEKMMLTNGLHRALERGEFLLHYQPQLTVNGDQVVGFEALLRWNSQEHGLVSPARFITLAEQSGLILPIGQWVLQEACKFARRLADMGKEMIHVAVNISPRQLMTDDFVTIVQKSIEDAGIQPEQIELEITESVLIESLEDSVLKLGQLRTLGVVLSLDDFGTGYSSLTYLRSLPVGILKIDKSFIDKIIEDETQLQLVGSIIELGHTLHLTIIAEGVETEEQQKLLRQYGCDCIQGYIFSRPMSEQAAIEFVTRTIS